MTPTAQIAAIRQRYVSRSQVRRLTVMDAGRVHDDICAIVAALDTRESALRALVAELRDRAKRRRMAVGGGRPGDYIQASHEAQAREIDMCAAALERLLESEP